MAVDSYDRSLHTLGKDYMNHLVQGIKKEKAYTGLLRGLNYYGGLVDVNTFGGPAVCFVLHSGQVKILELFTEGWTETGIVTINHLSVIFKVVHSQVFFCGAPPTSVSLSN